VMDNLLLIATASGETSQPAGAEIPASTSERTRRA
jgi:hypothetical protein